MQDDILSWKSSFLGPLVILSVLIGLLEITSLQSSSNGLDGGHSRQYLLYRATGSYGIEINSQFLNVSLQSTS